MLKDNKSIEDAKNKKLFFRDFPFYYNFPKIYFCRNLSKLILVKSNKSDKSSAGAKKGYQ